MNLQKTILSLLFLIMTSATVFAQKHIDTQVNNFIQEYNDMLTEKDKSLKLSEAQEAKARELYKSLAILESKAPKSEKKKQAFVEEMKPKRREIMRSIWGLFTPEQTKAFKSHKNNENH
ncbi:hypothetical protein Q4Q35_14800 [Flavivirga aquimarina]|uniref:DUF3106 domain-containing protein n=1 Tax=Flavivirga aquimarina TaxID=2027862 RepID=A0ABT8WD47_9FLAO|nr:hypothetical protein [Flavivirga aquimarina]MDO5971074.1 hypothetical protein [Flavivirga aquimarina]